MGWPELLNLLVLGLYLAGAVLVIAGALARREAMGRSGNVTAIVGFVLHAGALAWAVARAGAAVFEHGGFWFSLAAWLVLAIYLLVRWRTRLAFLSLTATPLACLLYAYSFALSSLKVIVPQHYSSLFKILHIGTLYSSMALLALAFGAGIFFVHNERKIKAKEKLKGMSRDLPSLSSFDRINAIAANVGFPLYTVGLFSGFLFSGLTRDRVFTWHPREIAALATWLLFAMLFHQRVALGWKGRKPAKLAIVLFVVTVLSMVAINLLAPMHHSLVPPAN